MPTSEPLQYSRINAKDLKMQIVKNLGRERSQRYFVFLNGLLAQKLTKSDFNKFCIPILGSENISLHNQLIRAILTNALQAKIPPRISLDKAAFKAVGKKPSHGANVVNHVAAPSSSKNTVLTNGHISPTPTHKAKLFNYDERTKDHPGASLTQNGRTEVAFQSSVSSENSSVRENGFLAPSPLKRPMQQQQDDFSEPPMKRPRAGCITPSNQAEAVREIHGAFGAVAVEDAKELRQTVDFYSKRDPLQAPLGIPFCSASVGGAQRSFTSVTDSSCCSLGISFYSGELCDTTALKKRMEKIAEAHGLVGVELDCTNLLNKAIDAYLNRLIRSCAELVGARLNHPSSNFKQQAQVNPINGVRLGNHTYVQNNPVSSEHSQRQNTCNSMSVEDFKVAMELNPQQLGEDWPVLLEKIYFKSNEE
ncbi:uncharacterized protein LOC122055352 [Zingiber officinale]|uniref:uncharacterized protein LOC122055352 n=1 Tax=Zingiber officinale TaxID=94328 RepID=UPI001C4AB606|nr:uncharacterized protein LOC122055352 [Zingiber officinale]XP_042472671.1 uncharacterized protein LOC122055352 [Zingiber officinale]XP_042472672.1 uncharacterized protein LOC122055352 [Zingiber officinale]XP_042472674.1 uncharacterized protein LOC122055352 [Zingiber officinale]XP_042472675.1 uncharacterized protein LOC122055352 [Zingiber officinale]XP_042472676.1 uncharacterized protein LOC122055352 [Zingiber officinale]XP_042472677.1 uncharacterized protein LOC122055352 [Zingiber officinal